MVFCSITEDSALALFDSVYKRLKERNAEFDPIGLIYDIYDLIYDKTKNHEQALTYASLVPGMADLAGLHSNAISKMMIGNVNTIFNGVQMKELEFWRTAKIFFSEVSPDELDKYLFPVDESLEQKINDIEARRHAALEGKTGQDIISITQEFEKEFKDAYEHHGVPYRHMSIVPVKKVHVHEALSTFDLNREGQQQTDETEAEIKDNIINHPTSPMAPGGESFVHAYNRVKDFVDHVLEDFKDGDVIVTHNTVFGLLNQLNQEGAFNQNKDKDFSDDKKFREDYTDLSKTFNTGDNFQIVVDGKTLNVVRHGETYGNDMKLYRRHADILNDKGKDEAEKLKNEFGEASNIFSSPHLRAIQTANEIANGKPSKGPIPPGPHVIKQTLFGDMSPEQIEIAKRMQSGSPVSEAPLPASEKVGGVLQGLGHNLLDMVIDDAREKGNFVFDQAFPRELKTVGDNKKGLPEIVDGVATLKTVDNVKLLRQHNFLQADQSQDWRIRLELVNDENKDFFYQRDNAAPKIVAMVVDQNGNRMMFGDDGKPSVDGKPLGFEYEYSYYLSNNLSTPRANLVAKKSGKDITPSFPNENPISDIFALLKSGTPVYGKIAGITEGQLATLHSTNTPSYSKTDVEMKPLNKMGLDRWPNVRLNGYTLDFPRDVPGQRTKIGQPSVYDKESGLYIPLRGKKLSEITKGGQPIFENKNTWLYKIIDALDKNGKVGYDDQTLEEGYKIGLDMVRDLPTIVKFLRELTYGKKFVIKMSDDMRNIVLVRPSGGSLWDAEINFVASKNPDVAMLNIPLSFDEEMGGMASIAYADFVGENFLSGAVRVKVQEGVAPKFAKINKRAVFSLDESSHELNKKIGGNKQHLNESQFYEGQQITYSDGTKYIISSINEDDVTLTEVGKPNSLINTSLSYVSKNYTVDAPPAQQEAFPERDSVVEKLTQIKAIPVQRGNQVEGQSRPDRVIEGTAYPSNLTATSLIYTTSVKSEDSGATVVGNIVDSVAKQIFSDEEPTMHEKWDKPSFESVVQALTSLRDGLRSEGYSFVTGVTLFDKDTKISGEADLLLVGKDGMIRVADIKTATMQINNGYLDKVSQFSNMTKRAEFATQTYIYAKLLEQMGLPVSKQGGLIIGLGIQYDKDLPISDTTINGFGGISTNDVLFKDIKPEFKDKSLSEISNIVAQVRKQDDVPASEQSVKPRKRAADIQRRGGLDSKVYEKLMAAAPEQLMKEIDQMKQMLGEDFAVNFVNEVNGDKYGNFVANMVTLYKNAIEGTGYHEGFHRFTQLYLTRGEKQSLYDIVRERGISVVDRAGNQVNTKNMTNLEVEEFLADEWANYAKDPSSYSFPGEKVNGLMGMFNKLWSFVKEWFSGGKDPLTLFKDLYQGKYSQREPDVNNAYWGHLNSAFVNPQGEEVLHNTRAQLYIDTASKFIGDALFDKGYTFKTLKNDVKVREKIMDEVFNGFVDVLENFQDKLSYPEDINDSPLTTPQYLAQNKAQVYLKNVQEGMDIENIDRIYNTIQEIDNLLKTGDENSNFESFVKFYMANTEIETIKGMDTDNHSVDRVFLRYAEDLEQSTSENGESEREEDDVQNDTDEVSDKANDFNKGPNNDNAFDIATQEIKDFFRTISSVKFVNGKPVADINELGVANTFDYYSLFNKVHKTLEGSTSIEEMFDRLTTADNAKYFPPSKEIVEKLRKIHNNDNTRRGNEKSNFAFMQMFFNVMSTSEVDNRQITANMKSNLKDNAIIVSNETLSKTMSSKQIRSWLSNFNRSEEQLNQQQKLFFVGDDVSNEKQLYEDDLFLYRKEDGELLINPFCEPDAVLRKIGYAKFLAYMGIELQPEMFENPSSQRYVEHLAGIIISNMRQYKWVAKSKFDESIKETANGIKGLTAQTILSNAEYFKANMDDVAKDCFINPVKLFSRRNSYNVQHGDGGYTTYETFSIIPAMEAAAEENEFYLPYASSGAYFNDGKTKYPFYQPSVLTVRTAILNAIKNVKDFNNIPSLSSLNPNTCPWIRRTVFFKNLFADNGDKKVRTYDEGGLSYTTPVKIELGDLSSLRIIGDNTVTDVHPRKLDQSSKLFFDMLAMFTNGDCEIPVAGTSSTIMSVKLSTYGGLQADRRFSPNATPIPYVQAEFANDTWRAIINDYFIGEMEKYKWHLDNGNLFNLDQKSTMVGKDINFFGNILEEEMKQKVLEDLKTMTPDQVFSQKGVEQGVQNAVKNWLTDNELDEDGTPKGDIPFIYKTIQGFNEQQKNALRSLFGTNVAISSDTDVQASGFKINADPLNTNRGDTPLGDSARTKGANDTSLLKAARAFAMNHFILGYEYRTWYMGDVNLFDKPFKRGNLTTNTGSIFNVTQDINNKLNEQSGETLSSLFNGLGNKDFGIIKSQILKDVKVNSAYYDNGKGQMIKDLNEYRTMHGMSPYTQDELKIFENYNGIKGSDGQGKISLDFYRTIMKVYNLWDENTHEKEYRRQIAIFKTKTNRFTKWSDALQRNVKMTDAEVEETRAESQVSPYSFFNPLKVSHTGPQHLLGKEGFPSITHFDKMSLSPLIPEVVYNNNHPDKVLMEEMAMGGYDYVKYQSADKGAALNPVSFFDNLGRIVQNQAQGKLQLDEQAPEYLYSVGLKHQLNTDGMHDTNIWGSQQRNILADVMFLPEVIKNSALHSMYDKLNRQSIDLQQQLVDMNRQSFLRRFGLSDYKPGEPLSIENQEVFTAAINDIVKSNGFPQTALNYLEYNSVDKSYSFSTDLMFQRKELAQVIGGILDGELRRIKLKGTAAYQVSSVGTSNAPTNSTQDQINKYGTTGLHYYHLVRDKEGNIVSTSTMGIKLTLQGDFKNLLSLQLNGKDIRVTNVDGTTNYEMSLKRLNKALRDEAWRAEHLNKLKVYGYRIPTSNNNFLEHMEVMEFIPESAGNIVIAPPEAIIKSGSDFDIDKMNLMFPSIDKEGNYVGKPKQLLKELYDALYSKIDNINDYKSDQKTIKSLLSAEEKDWEKYSAIMHKAINTVMERLYEIDNTRADWENDSFEQIRQKFADEISTNEPLTKKLSMIDMIDGVLSESSHAMFMNQQLVDTEFVNLLKKINQHKDYVTNQLLENMTKTMSTPSYYQMLITPSTSEMVKNIAVEMGKLTNSPYRENYTAANNMSYKRNLDIHKNYRNDTSALGGFAINRIWYSKLNHSEFKVNKIWKYNGKRDMIIHLPLIDPSMRSLITDGYTMNMYGDSIYGTPPRDVWDQLMSAVIDLPSGDFYPKLGINATNKKVFSYLIEMKHDMEHVVAFLNHPVLTEVTKIYNDNKSKYGTFYIKNAAMLMAKKIGLQKDLMSKAKQLGIAERNFNFNTDDNNKPSAIYTFAEGEKMNKIGGTNSSVHLGAVATHLLSEEDHFSKQDLINDIKRGKWDGTEQERERSKKVLLYFCNLLMESGTMSTFKFAYSDDRVKNTNLLTINSAISKKEQIRGNLNNNDPVNGSMFDKRSVVKIERDSVFKVFNYTDFAKQVYENMFSKILSDPSATITFNNLMDKSFTFGIDKEKLAEKILGDYVEFVYKNYGKPLEETYNPFTDQIEKREETRFSDYFLQRIYNINKQQDFKSYNVTLAKMLEMFPELKQINIVGRIETDGKASVDESKHPLDGYDATNIRLRRSDDNPVTEQNFYSSQLENLINFNPAYFNITRQYTPEQLKKVSLFFTELAHLSLYQAGPTNIANNFSDMIPARMWSNFVNDAFEKFSHHSPAEKSLITKAFAIMFTENNRTVNWSNNRIVYDPKYFGSDIMDDVVKNKTKDTKYFVNFTSGKMYDLEKFRQRIKNDTNTDICF